jgi:hypothetical protein
VDDEFASAEDVFEDTVVHKLRLSQLDARELRLQVLDLGRVVEAPHRAPHPEALRQELLDDVAREEAGRASHAD